MGSTGGGGGGGKHSLLKLGSSLLSAYRHYSTTLSSGDGTRKERKRSAKSPDAREVSLALPLEKQDIYCMKKGEVSISPTASPNAWDSTGEKHGLREYSTPYATLKNHMGNSGNLYTL